MGLWDVLNGAAGKLRENKEEVERYMMELDRFSTQQLMNMYKSSTGAKKMACMQLIRQRNGEN